MDASRRQFLLGAASAIAVASGVESASAVLYGGPVGGSMAMTDSLTQLRQAIAVCIDRCLNPAWVIPKDATFDMRPGGLIDARCHQVDNSAEWDRLDVLHERYIALMGGKDAPMSATEMEVMHAKFGRETFA